jgi:ubiquinone/menaquinone biosynthesis C-methylase UbiE
MKLQETIAPSSTGSRALALLHERGDNPHRPCLENRVAYQWEFQGDTLGYMNGTKKDRLTLEWLGEAVQGRPGAAVLDVGCAYGNMLLMLNARLGKPAGLRLVGVDLYPESMEYARAFAAMVPGYQNCEYQVADLSKRLPFDDHTFDAINLGDVLEHMDRPDDALRELARVAKPGGIILISTPLKNSLFKRLARLANRMTGGRLYRAYYKGKSTELDEKGEPIMETHVGNDHVSEMTPSQLAALLKSLGLTIERREMMPVMSGSRWFDRHPFLLSAMMFIEAVHGVLRLSSWAHSICLTARTPAMSPQGRARA